MDVVDESVLNKAISQLSFQKADAMMKALHEAVEKAAEPFLWFRKANSSSDHLRPMVTAVLRQTIQEFENVTTFNPKDVDEKVRRDLAARFYGEILNEVLTKLPLVKELVSLQDALPEG